MREDRDKITRLYDTFVADGYDMESEDDFRKNMSDAKKRKAAYDALVNDGYEMEPFDEFENNIGYGSPKHSSESDPVPASSRPDRPQGRNPTGQEKRTMRNDLSQMAQRSKLMIQRSKQMADAFHERMDNMREYGMGLGIEVKEGKKVYNPESGKFEQTYLTPVGNRYNSKALADAEQRQIKDAMERELHPVEAELRDAYAERDRLNKLADERIDELEQDYKERPWWTKLGEYANSDKMPDAGSPHLRWGKDTQYTQYMAALRKNQELITMLEDARDKRTNEFWHSLGKEITNGYTFSLAGKSRLDDVASLAFAQRHINTINKKRQKGEPLTKEEQAAEAVLKNAEWDNRVQGQYGDQYGAWARAGKMGAVSADLMTDFLLMGGQPLSLAKNVAGSVGKVGTRLFGEAATKGFGKFMVKATGATVGSMVAGAEIANTIGIGRTMADAAGRYMGDVMQDEDGNFVFGHFEDDGQGGRKLVEGGDSFLGAVLGAERSAIAENASEIAGEFLPGSKFLLKGMEKIGLSKIASHLTSLGGKQWYKAYSKSLEAMGFHGVPGEALEEYVGTGFDALMGGDEWKNLADKRTHIDIWLGCATMGALLNAPRAIGTGTQMAQYYRYKHNADKASARASIQFGTDTWEPLREKIDGATNEQITDVLLGVLDDESLNDEQKNAVANYAGNLQRMRGYSLGRVSTEGRTEETAHSAQQEADDHTLNRSYAEGYSLETAQEMNDARNMLDYQRQRMIEVVGANEESLEDGVIDWLNEAKNAPAGSERRQTILDYLNAKQVYDGMIQRVRDDIDGRIGQSDAMIDSRTNRVTGMIQGATMKQDDRKVYVVSGNLVPYADGTGVDIHASDGSIIVRDAETGALEQVSPDAVLSVEEAQDPSEQKRLAADTIRLQLAQEAAGKIDGIVSFNPGDTYTLEDEDGEQIQIQVTANGEGIVDNGDGTVNVTDGASIFQVTKDVIQQAADAANLARVEEFEKRRAAEEMARKQAAEEAAKPQYAMNDLITLRDGNGNSVRGSITADADADGRYEVYTEDAVNGKRVNLFTRDELDNMIVEHNGEIIKQLQPDGTYQTVWRNETDVDENGNAFVKSDDGTTIFGEITEDTGLSSAPIKLSEGTVDKDGNGYGLRHIEARHGEQIRKAGFASVEDFVKYVAANYDKNNIKVGKRRVNGSGTFIIQKEDEHSNLLYIELSRDGSYWTVNSGGVFRKGYTKKKENVEPASELPASDTASSDKSFVQTDLEDGSKPADTHSDNQRFSFRKVTNSASEKQENGTRNGVTALERIPKDEQGNPVYEQAETPDLAWDAIVEQAGGNEEMAQTVADGMVADKEAALKKIEKSKPKGGRTVEEKIAAEKERKAAVDAAKQELDIWQKIAQTTKRRKIAAESERRRIATEQAALRRAEEEKLRAEREEAERKEREALNGVPDMVDDTPQDARARGYRRVNGHKYDRQAPVPGLQGKKVSVKFGDGIIPTGNIAVIESRRLQPSHIAGQRNPLHFIDEAQPKERNDEASVLSAEKIAGNIRPEEITSSVTAFTGAPTVNARGEAIQGNNRSDALRRMWESHPDQAAKYKQYLKDHADEFGLDADDVEAMERPVLVNMLDVEDADAITLGQYVAQDTESGGTERIKPKNAVQKMGADMRTFANLLLSSSDEETSFAGLVDNNGGEVLAWMNRKGYITPTQYKSAFDSKGNLTAEAKNDLKGIMYQSIFQNGNTRLEEMFNAMPAKAQRAILATAYRDYDSPNAERMVEEIQNSIRAYNALSQDEAFVSAKNWKEARMAVEAWKRQYAMDDVTGESYLPADKFSNFAMHLATMYKGESQSLIQGTFNQLYDLIQGTQEETLFEKPDNTPRTLIQAIKETLNIDYNGQQRSNVLAGGSAAGQEREQGSAGASATGERVEGGKQSTDSGEGITGNSGRIGTDSKDRGNKEHERKETNSLEDARDRSLTDFFGPIYTQFEGNADAAEKFLREACEGVAKGALLYPGVAPIDIAWGDKKAGYMKIVIKHPEVIGKLQDILSSTTITSQSDNRIVFENKRHKVIVSKMKGNLPTDNWLLTAYEKKKKSVSASSSDIETEPKGKRNGTATPQNGLSESYQRISERKVTNSAAERQGNSAENSPKPADETINGLNKRPLLWERGAKDVSSSTDAASASVSTGKSPLSGEQSGSASHQSKGLLKDKELSSHPMAQIEESVPLNDSNKPTSTDNQPALLGINSSELNTSFDSKGTNNSRKSNELGEKIAKAEAEVNTEPTPAQAEAGNYKKGHVTIGGFDITIENPAGSTRKGVDADGKEWSTTMANTYGYIKGTEGVDGDHIDVFLSNDIDGWNGRKAFVVDQTNTDGSFDEHKVMLGFNDKDEAMKAYLANYDATWEKTHPGLRISETDMGDFNKWVQSSHRKTKPFADYSTVRKVTADAPAPVEQTDGNRNGEDLFAMAERIAKEDEIRRTAAHFPMETPEEAASFDKRVQKMSDEELLAYMREDGNGNVNKAHHPSVYDEYDDRHGDELLASYDEYLPRLAESNTTKEQAEEMLANLQTNKSVFATDERPLLLGQEEALQDYIAELENKEAEADAEQHGTETSEVTFNPAGLRLRKLEDGETCHVERVYEESRMFDFTGKDRIESEEDVAFIFRQLENAAVENSFLVLVKDGMPTVIHLGMGNYSSVMAPFEQAFVAYSELKPDKVYFVHNHPSGALKASLQDQGMIERIKEAFGEDVVMPGIIIDTTSGKYGLFGMFNGISIEKDIATAKGDEVPIKVYHFGKQVFAPDWNPKKSFKVTSSDDVAAFVSSHRLGEHKKMSFLVMGNDGSVVANVFLPWTKLSDIDDLEDACKLMAGYVHQCGGIRGVLYGNYDYTAADGKLLNKISARMKELGASLLDAIHIDHSANDEGVLREPGADVDTSTKQKRAETMEDVNRKFNKELETLTQENAQSVTLNLGHPGAVLKSAGISDRPIRLYGNKLLKKIRKHGFSTSDVKNLPIAINSPIAVFNNYGNGKNRAVLTELKTTNGNVLATIEWGKGSDAEINIVTSVFGKGSGNIVDWLNRGFATYIDKEKALEYLRISALNAEAQDKQGLNQASDYLHHSAPIAEALSNPRLSSATKVVENFENPALSDEKENKKADTDKKDEMTFDGKDDNLMQDSDTMYRIRESDAPKKTGTGYKVFVLKNGKLYPPMVANPNGEATPVGVWLDADAAPIAGQSKTGRNQVKAGGKGTQGGSGKLAYRPGWHLGEIPYALQFNRINPETGEKELFPANFVWAEVEYANDKDYQEEAMSYGMNANGKFQHSLAGLPRIPENGSYRYRTNPNPETDPWIITGAMKVNRLLTPSEVDAMVEDAGREPQQRQEGAVTDEQINALNAEIERTSNISPRQLRKQMAERVKELADALHLDNVDVVTNVSGLKDGKKRAKGFYTKSTGKITIVVPNNTGLADVEQTLLHEAVAHYGLRQLFGEHFDTFLDNVLNNADESIRRRIVDMATKNGWDFRKATEEYLAGLAERTNFEEAQKTGWWQRIKRFFSDMLDKLGFPNLRGVTLSDNELRYILWRSYENLKDGNRNSLFYEAADIAMQYELGVGEYADSPRAVNERFNEELKRYEKGEMGKNEYIQVGNPMGIMRSFMPDVPIILRQKVVTKANNKHKLTASEIRDLPKSLANPIFVFKSRKNTISVLTELKSNKGQNVFVAMELGTSKQMGHEFLEVNDITTIHGRETENIVNPILENGTLRYVNKEKGIKWLSSAKSNSQAIVTETLSTAAKIVENFENPKIGDGNPNLRGVNPGDNERFNEELKRYEKGEMDKNEMFHLGMPNGVMRMFLPDLPIVMRPRIINKASNTKHNVDISSIENLPKMISSPIFVFNRSDNKLGILTDAKDRDGLNICVAIELNRTIQDGGEMLEVNDVRSVHGRDEANIIKPIAHNNTLVYADKKKGLAYLSSASSNYQQEIDKQDLSTAAKIVENFENPKIGDGNDVLFRDGAPVMYERQLARDRYEKRMKSGMYQSREALQDSMLSVKEAMLMTDKRHKHIEDVEGFENAYLGENRLSSVNQAEADAFAHLLFKPMLEEVARLARNEAERVELTDYMMAKHGLERNRVMAERDAQKDFEEHQKKHPQSKKTLQDFIGEYRKRDYAGLTALTGMDNVADAEAEAQAMVDEYESAHDTAPLWEKVNAVSKAILSKQYECGMMSKETYENVRDMYAYYIPLRGFDEKTSGEAYAYLTHRQSAFNAPIKKAEGRRSKADDPFANLQSMAESAIMQGNRNRLVKQKFLNFVLNHPSDLVSVSDLWLQYDAVADEWRPVFPDNIDDNDTPDVVEQKMKDFEDRMRQLAESDPDNYKHGKDTANIPYRVVENRDLRQHQVVVKRNGRDYVITVNGNPRLAQALNGQTNPDNDISGAIGKIMKASEWVNRHLSAVYTTKNPDFVVSNFVRDMLYTNSMVWIKESPNYALRFHRNVAKANIARMKLLLAKHRKGTLDMNKPIEAMFHQFMMNGGETGYTNIRDIEQHRNDIRRELKKANGKLKVSRAWDLLGERFDELNRAVENSARFAAFMTSREMGRTIDRAIYDAKEISVNFNKKGSGAKFLGANGQTRLGDTSAFLSGVGRSSYVFWNAAIQGTANFGRQMKRHPAKALTGAAAMFVLGAIIAYLGGSGDDGDDDDKNAYYNLPEHVRRSNILFRAGNHWISLPLPVEYRALYGMGELMTSVFSGKEHLTGGEIASAIAGQATQMLPIDFLEGGGGLNAFVPSAAKPLWEAYVAEKSWTGMPLYKDTPYNKDMPEWTKAYQSANKHIVNLAAVLNETTGGDPYTKGAIDINPAKVEYLLNGYFGGVFGTIDKLAKTGETILGDREYDPRNILLVNRLVKAGDERTEYRAVNNEYFRLKEEHDRVKSRLKHYENDTDNGIFDYAEKIDFLYNSPEYERYEIFEDYRRDIDGLYDELKDVADDDERKQVESELNALKKEMIEEMEKTRKRK